MDVPRFPAPPALVSRSVSLQEAPCAELGSGGASRRRPRSASWLVARRHRQQAGRRRSRRSNHVQPLHAAVARSHLQLQPKPRRHITAELTLTMTETRYPRANDDDEANDAGHRANDERKHRPEEELPVLDRIRESRSPRTIKEDQVDETEIICSAAAEGSVKNEVQRTEAPTTISKRLSPIHQQPEEAQILSNNVTAAPSMQKPLRSTAVQTFDRVMYRLRVFPTLKDIVDEENKPPDPKRSSRLFRYFRFLGRVALCQFGLAWLLTIWAILGAGAFYVTEGPRERQQVLDLKDMQRDLAVGLATELRQLRADDKEMEPLWSAKVRQYVARHEKLLLIAVSSGYGEGGDNGQLWTFPGCVLFAISVLTTLGFGAPVPRTNAGRTVAVIFAAIGIPAHFLLVLNLGLIFAVKLKRYGIMKKYPSQCRDLETTDAMPIPTWVKIAPFLAIAIYYIIGIICFGAARLRPFYASLLFPLDFTAAGGLSTIAGYVRILYGVFLEGAIFLTAIAVAIAKVSATQSLTNIGLKYGLLIPV